MSSYWSPKTLIYSSLNEYIAHLTSPGKRNYSEDEQFFPEHFIQDYFFTFPLIFCLFNSFDLVVSKSHLSLGGLS